MSTLPATAVASADRLAALIARVQCGDEAAFADLYDLTHVQLGSIVARTLRALEHSAEVMQEVFLYAWQHARSYDAARGTVLAWLSVLARGRAIDRVRSVTRLVARDHRCLDPNKPRRARHRRPGDGAP